tara:strand:+ start:1886 stop:2068 length:183 start_codon:yes stop_codon:yes gene_type:complete
MVGKKKQQVNDIGKCKYCKINILSTDSFVSFYPKGHAHYSCMKKADEDKTYENESSKFNW